MARWGQEPAASPAVLASFFPPLRPRSREDGTTVDWDPQGVKCLETGHPASVCCFWCCAPSHGLLGNNCLVPPDKRSGQGISKLPGPKVGHTQVKADGQCIIPWRGEGHSGLSHLYF